MHRLNYKTVQLRFLETLQCFRAEMAAGRIGAVHAVRCEIGQYLPAWRPDADYRTTVSAQKALGGGVLLELSHELDLLRWVFGEVDWLSAWIGRQSALETHDKVARRRAAHSAARAAHRARQAERQAEIISFNTEEKKVRLIFVLRFRK